MSFITEAFAHFNENTLENFKKTISSYIDNNKQFKSAMLQKLRGVRDTIKKISENFAKRTEKMKALEEELQQTTKELNDLKASLTQCDNTIKLNEEEKEELEQEITKLQAEMAELRKAKDPSETNELSQRQINELQEKINALEQEKTQLEEKVRQLENEKNELSTNINKTQEEKTGLENNLVTLQEELTKNINELKAQLEQIQENIKQDPENPEFGTTYDEVTEALNNLDKMVAVGSQQPLNDFARNSINNESNYPLPSQNENSNATLEEQLNQLSEPEVENQEISYENNPVIEQFFQQSGRIGNINSFQNAPKDIVIAESKKFLRSNKNKPYVMETFTSFIKSVRPDLFKNGQNPLQLGGKRTRKNKKHGKTKKHRTTKKRRYTKKRGHKGGYTYKGSTRKNNK